jgi:hypothetical protein
MQTYAPKTSLQALSKKLRNLPVLGDIIYGLTVLRTRTLFSDCTAAVGIVHIYFCAYRSPCSSPTRTARNLY